MRARTAAAGLLVALCAGAAWAGRTNYFETSVDTTTRTAFGSLYDTRHSADTVQYIGCNVSLVGGVARVTCEARNAANVSLSCSSSNAEVVKIAQSLSDSSYVNFTCDTSTPTPTTLNYLYVSNNSVWLP